MNIRSTTVGNHSYSYSKNGTTATISPGTAYTVVYDGDVTFNNASGTLDIDSYNDVNGPRALTINGQPGSATVLYGTNNYSGPTTINGGATLRVGSAGAFPGTSAVTIATNGTFDLNGFDTTMASLSGDGSVTLGSGALTEGSNNADTTFSGVISGGGGLNKVGSGTFTLTGSNTYTGGTTITAGTLSVKGSLVGLLNVLSGGTLAGTGTVGSVDNSGIVAPGNSIGTLNLAGNYTQRSGGTLQIQINPTSADKLTVSGNASLDGTLSVLPDAGSYSAGTKYQILTAKSVSGTFKTVAVSNADRLGGLVLGAQYFGTEVDLQLMGSQAASTEQQEESIKTVAPEVTRQAIQLQNTIISTHLASILFPPDFARALAVPASPTGPSTPSTPSAPSDTEDKVGKRTSDRGRSGLAAGDAPGGGDSALKGLSAWGDASVALLNNGDSASKYDGLQKAGTLGVDYRFSDNLLAGVALTPIQANTNLRTVDGNRDTTVFNSSAYAGYKFDEVYAVQAIAGYGRAFNDTEQQVAGLPVKDRYNTNRFMAQIGFSAAYMLEDDLRLIPSLTYTHTVESGSKQHSSDGAPVEIPVVRLGTLRAGAQLDYAVTAEIVPFITAGVERDIVSSTGATGRQGYSVGGGVQAPLDDNLTLGFAATVNFGRNAQTENQFAAHIRYSW